MRARGRTGQVEAYNLSGLELGSGRAPALAQAGFKCEGSSSRD